MFVGCGRSVRGIHGGLLGADDVAGEGALETGLLNGGGANGTTEAVVETGDGGEKGRFELLQVVHQTKDIAMEKANGAACPEGAGFVHAFVDVG